MSSDPTAARTPDVPPARMNRESLRDAAHLFAYLLPYRVRFVAALLALFLSSLLSLSFPYITGLLVDRSIGGPEAVVAGLTQIGIDAIVSVLLVSLALQALLAFFHSISFAAVGERSLADLRPDTFAPSIPLPIAVFAHRPAA